MNRRGSKSSRDRGGKGRHPTQRGSHPAQGPRGRSQRDDAPRAHREPEAPPGSRSFRPGHSVEGIVSAHRSGYGFVRVQGMAESVFLPPPQMASAMHGDRVRVELARDSQGRWSGRLEEVLERGVSAFLGTVEILGRAAWVQSADRRLGLRCLVAPADLNEARHGDWVIARIARYSRDGNAPHARIERRLDPERPVELATEAAMARYDLSHDFAAEVQREAQAFGDAVDPAEAASRIDLRGVPLVTIDGEDARDFDDAVFAEPHADGFRLIVAIADVSHYVRPGTPLDLSARARGTSVYFPTRVVPMLPTALSNHLCSLAPHVDRLCFAADMIVTTTGRLKSSKFYPAVMRSASRLTYTQAHAALFEGRPDVCAALGDLVPKLLPLVDVYRALLKSRRRRGALDFDAPEAKFDIDEHERVRGIQMYARNDAHKLIEECMILANVAVAQELARRRVGSLYRVHGSPERKKLDILTSTLNALGVAAELPEMPKPRDLQRLTQRLGHSTDRPFFESLIVRSMQQALYQPENIGHFGLALSHYAHFTSPIRRYPDLVVHRTLKALCNEADPSGARHDGAQLAVLGEDLSRLEKRADEADRYVSSFLKIAWLRDRVGQTFEGLITTVVEFGCFVQILNVMVDGLLHVDSLRDDRYVMDKDGHAWVGEASGRRLRIGSRIHVLVTAANPIEGLVDLDLAAIDGPATERPVRHHSRSEKKRR